VSSSMAAVAESSKRATLGCTVRRCFAANEDYLSADQLGNEFSQCRGHIASDNVSLGHEGPLRCFIRLLEADMRTAEAQVDTGRLNTSINKVDDHVAGDLCGIHEVLSLGNVDVGGNRSCSSFSSTMTTTGDKSGSSKRTNKLDDRVAGDLCGIHEVMLLDNVDVGGSRSCSSPGLFSSPITTTSDKSASSERTFDHQAVERARRRASEHRKQRANMAEAASVARRQQRFGRRDARLEQFLRLRLAAESLGGQQSGCLNRSAETCLISTADCMARGERRLHGSRGNDSSFIHDESSFVSPNSSDGTDEDLERLLLEEIGPEGLSGGRRPPRPYKEVPMEPEYSSVD